MVGMVGWFTFVLLAMDPRNLKIARDGIQLSWFPGAHTKENNRQPLVHDLIVKSHMKNKLTKVCIIGYV